MKTLLIFTVASFILFSCSKQPQEKTSVNVDTLASVYAELLVLNERYNLSKDSMSAQQYETDYEETLRKHDYTKARFVAELESVAQTPGPFRQLCDLASNKIQEMRKKSLAQAPRGRS